MKTFKLALDDFLDDDFELLAIHTTLESYHLAYFINTYINTKLHKSDLLPEFEFFEYEDKKNQSLWSLVSNVGVENLESNDTNKGTLFAPQNKKKIYILPEYKKVDYLVKIEQNTQDIQEIISKINTIPQVITAFSIAVKNLKSKSNLIFH